MTVNTALVKYISYYPLNINIKMIKKIIKKKMTDNKRPIEFGVS